jgi:glycosyltransferase involved in cell wall biosynthesis
VNSSPSSSPEVLRAAAIVPAYNEAGRIGDVLRSIAASQLVSEIIVVTDGCSDSTAEEARGVAARTQELVGRDMPFRIYELQQNIGKGGAMAYGAHRTDADVLLFLDADLIGLKSEQVDALLKPTLEANPEKRADMTLGLFGTPRGGVFGWWLGFCHRNVAAITGQRAIRRDVFLAIPDLTRSRFGVEIAITRYVHAWKLRMEGVPLHNVTHPIKEEKIGIFKGMRHRVNMYGEIAFYVIADTLRNSLSEPHRHQTLKMRERFGSDSD